MDALVRVADDPTAANSLLKWFEAEDDLRGRIRPERIPVAPGEMGALWDAIRVQVGREGALAALVRSAVGWLRSRERYKGSAVKITIRLGDDEATVDLDRIDADVDSVNALVQQLSAALRTPPER